MNPAFSTYGTNAPSDDDYMDAAEWLGCEPEEVTTDDLLRYEDACREAWAERE